jgi:uncharacterized repeat protein (TIGR03837 family)
MTAPRWDVFCKVVDNFGDIGIAWRLARTLAAEHGIAVRLWVDDLASFARIWPTADPTAAAQRLCDVDVRRWAGPMLGITPADVVVETFQCDVPEPYVQAMAALAVKPRWINLDYLSAEDWVAGCHGLPSPHPRLPLVKHFYFPGFDRGTGGLLLERGLLEARAAFVADRDARERFWSGLGLGLPGADERRVSLFCYPCAPVVDLVRAWADGTDRVTCLVPEGQVAQDLLGQFGAAGGQRRRFRAGAAEVHVIPFTDQDRYDRFLWACDVNFVRGEDSFVRAQWAQHPWVWNIYPQRENTHWIKLNAFLDRWGADLAPEVGAATRDLWRAWNGLATPAALADAWSRFARVGQALERHGEVWAGRTAGLGSLAANLVRFCQGLI